MDDLRRSASGLGRLQAFLGVDDDERTAFATKNARDARSGAATRMLRGLQRAKNWIMPGRSLVLEAGLGRALEQAPTEEEMALSPTLRRAR